MRNQSSPGHRAPVGAKLARAQHLVFFLAGLILVPGSKLSAAEVTNPSSWSSSAAAKPGPAGRLLADATAVEAAQDSVRPFTDPFATSPTREGNTDPFGEDLETTDWDSVFAAYDRRFGVGSGKVVPLVGFRYGKVEGVHLDGGVALREVGSRFLALEARGGYDFARERPNGSARIRIGDVTRETYWFEAGIHDGVRPFGSHQPFGNTLFTLIGGYDGAQYLRRRGWHAGGQWTHSLGLRFDLAFERDQDSPLLAKEDWHLFGSDRWMQVNEAATSMLTNAIRFRVQHRPPYSTETVRPGWYASMQAAVHGGSGLGGDREFTRAEADLERRWFLREDRDQLRLAADGAVVGGDAPRQALADLGGHGGLRGFEPRSFVGTARAFSLAEYAYAVVWPRTGRIPLIRRLRFHLVPFAEVGAVWADPLTPFDPGLDLAYAPIDELGDLRRPRLNETHWDLGIGLRRVVETTGLVYFVEVDFAWPMGADTGPVRVTARLSSRGFD